MFHRIYGEVADKDFRSAKIKLEAAGNSFDG